MTGNDGFSTSYDYKTNKVYKYYKEQGLEYLEYHTSIIINNINKEVQLIDSDIGGAIRIWNFHTAQLLNKIDIIKIVGKQILYGLCLWNKEYLFVGNNRDEIILLNLKDNKKVNKFKCNNGQYISTIKKMLLPKYGECLISLGDKAIQLWINKK